MSRSGPDPIWPSTKDCAGSVSRLRTWAYAQHKDDWAVVINLMETERVAPQVLRYNVVAREILRELLKRERRTATPGLRALAARAGVLK